MRHSHHTSRRGLSILEAIVAIVILGVAMPSLLFALRRAHMDRATPVLASRARWLAIEGLEDVLADRASPGRGYTYLVDTNYPPEASVAGFPGFSRTVSITETGVDLDPGTGAKVVTVTVGWTDLQSNAASLELSSAVAELGP